MIITNNNKSKPIMKRRIGLLLLPLQVVVKRSALVLLGLASGVILFRESSSSCQSSTATTTTPKFDDNNNNHLDKTVSLVTSYWVTDQQPSDDETAAPTNPHRIEIEAAMIANLANPFLSQLVVILDNVSSAKNCSYFEKRLTRLYQKYSRGGSLLLVNQNITKLTCIPHYGEAGSGSGSASNQPSYLEMFQYTQHPLVTGRVVVLANVDHVFDETLWRAQYLRPNTLLTLSTRGYQISSSNYAFYVRKTDHQRNFWTAVVPPQLQDYYTHIVTTTHLSSSKNPLLESSYAPVQDWCFDNTPKSWDTYLFDKTLLEGKLPSKIDGTTANSSSSFMKRNGKTFPMNVFGAENAALFDLINAIFPGSFDDNNNVSWASANNNGNEWRPKATSASEIRIWNACQYIHSFHFHKTPKTHQTTTRVPFPHAFASLLPPQQYSEYFYLA